MNVHEVISKRKVAEAEIAEDVLRILGNLEKETGVRPAYISVDVNNGFGIGGGSGLFANVEISFGI